MAAAWPGPQGQSPHTHTSVQHGAKSQLLLSQHGRSKAAILTALQDGSGINAISLAKPLEATDHLTSTILSASPLGKLACSPRCFPAKEGGQATYAVTTDVRVTLTITQRLTSASSPGHASYSQLPISRIDGLRGPGSRRTLYRGQRSPHL